MNMTVEDLEKLITAFQATVPVIEALVKSANEILNQNKIFREKIDEKAFLSLLDKDIISTQFEQKMINKSLSYMFIADDELINQIIEIAQKNNDKELLNYWFKKRVS